MFVDETGVHLGFTRLFGRAPQGERVYDSEPGNSGQNISLIGGMSIDGLIATLSIPGSVNTDVFLFYIQEILIPQLWVTMKLTNTTKPCIHNCDVARQN